MKGLRKIFFSMNKGYSCQMFGKLGYTKNNIFLYQNYVKLCFNMLIRKVNFQEDSNIARDFFSKFDLTWNF